MSHDLRECPPIGMPTAPKFTKAFSRECDVQFIAKLSTTLLFFWGEISKVRDL